MLFSTTPTTTRLSGAATISDLMVAVSEALELMGGMTQTDAFDGAFINNWDVGNLVSDYLMQRGVGEGCDCNTNYANLPPATNKAGGEVETADLSSEFDRHKFLSDIMSGEVGWDAANSVLRTCALCRLADSGYERVRMSGRDVTLLEPLGEGCGKGNEER